MQPEDVLSDAEFMSGLPQPLFWRVLVMPDTPKTMSAGGIALPEQTQEAEKYLNYVGCIVAVGALAGKDKRFEGEPNFPVEGDWVIYGRYAGQVVKYRGKRLLLVNDDEILAVARDRSALKIHVE